ncbi:MAG: ATP-binding protein [Methanospirillum sp.]
MDDAFDVIGQVVGGDSAAILFREKSGQKVELGELLAIDVGEGDYLLLKVTDLAYGSQISEPSRELAAGLRLEQFGDGLMFYESELRNYTIGKARAVLRITDGATHQPKSLPPFFSNVRRAVKADFKFLEGERGVFLGRVRSGTQVLDVPVVVDVDAMLQHHVLIPATTGRGKSNCLKVMLWHLLDSARAGVLVLDPHDEYFGRHGEGLRRHPRAKDGLAYYTPPGKDVSGASRLAINLHTLRPVHFSGILDFPDAQLQAMTVARTVADQRWIEHVITTAAAGGGLPNVQPTTLAALARKLSVALGVEYVNGAIVSRNPVFVISGAETVVDDICDQLEEGRIVVIDTSRLYDHAELLVGSVIIDQIFSRHIRYRTEGTLHTRPTVGVVIEEAPRVLSKERVHAGSNVYARVAREGRKFKVGLIAVTQLASVIPVEILANMNTKIILGNELVSERNAIANSAAQDLSADARAIASLDKGEAIVSSTFTHFAIPIQIPLFSDLVAAANKEKGPEMEFIG